MKKTKEDAALTRQVVLDAAAIVFSRKGFLQTTLEEVAKEAGVTRGAIYWHFGNKIEMFSAVLNGYYKKLEKRATKILNSDQRPIKKLRQLMGEILLMASNSDVFWVIEELQLLRASKDQELNRLYKSHLEDIKNIRGMLNGLIADGIAAGELDSHLDPRIATLASMSYLAGMRTILLSDISEISITGNIDKLIDIFISGIA